MTTDTHALDLAEIEQFKDDVLAGLTLPDKELYFKYCFDDIGSTLFSDAIKNLSFYPYSSEANILNEYKNHIALYLENEPFNIIEFGPGAGVNSPILIDDFLQNSLNITYNVIDASRQYLTLVTNKFHTQFPALKINSLHANYLAGLKTIHSLNKQRNLLLFLGMSISGTSPLHLAALLKKLRRMLNSGDYILIGFDLRKNIENELSEYNNPTGLFQTLSFNLLKRINRELNGNFKLANFEYIAKYNNDMESINQFLISKEQQTVEIKALKQTFEFLKDEPIYLGSAFKYREQQILTLAEANGFEAVQMYTDNDKNFINSLWKIDK
jgi:L-histidine N-alpha-methyltransferase